MYLQAVAERLRGKPFDDADVWRAAVAAMREFLREGARGASKLCWARARGRAAPAIAGLVTLMPSSF
jgi:hypothetical protein